MSSATARDKNYITPAGFQRLRDEYQKLVSDERPKLLIVIEWAASNGDRSENADYQYGKRRLREIDRRLRELSIRIEHAEVVDPAQLSGTKVLFGATVTIENEDGETSIYQIVGEDEFDPASQKISWRSPLAKALFGKSVDDEVTVQKPAGPETYTILDVAFK